MSSKIWCFNDLFFDTKIWLTRGYFFKSWFPHPKISHNFCFKKWWNLMKNWHSFVKFWYKIELTIITTFGHCNGGGLGISMGAPPCNFSSWCPLPHWLHSLMIMKPIFTTQKNMKRTSYPAGTCASILSIRMLTSLSMASRYKSS